MQFNPIISEELPVPAAHQPAGLSRVRVRKLTTRHLERIQQAAIMAVPAHVFERMQAAGSLGGASADRATLAEAERRNAERRAAHPSHGLHEATVVACGVYEVDGARVDAETMDAALEVWPAALVTWLADEIARFSGLGETETDRGEGAGGGAPPSSPRRA